MKKIYYKIDVLRGYGHGYSFIVCSNEEWDNEDIIKECLRRELFDDEEDADHVVEIDKNPDQYDIDHLSEFTYDLDE